jgi:galactonate dehydratase
MMTDVPWRGEVTTEEVEFTDGRMTVPTRPGLGIDIVEEACAAHPYKPYKLRHYRGTLTDIRPENAVPFYKRGQTSPQDAATV